MGTTAQTVREVLQTTYSPLGVVVDDQLISEIVIILENPDKSKAIYAGAVTPAAYETRMKLWDAYTGELISAKATAAILTALGRESEIGWMLEDAEENHTS